MNDVSKVAKEVFAGPFFTGRGIRHEHKSETPLKLALALMPSGVTYGQLNALALAVRAVGSLEGEAPNEPLSKKQKTAWNALVAEKGLPLPFRSVLEAAAPHLEKRRDLYALYGVLAGTMEKLTTLGAVAELAASDEPARKPLTARRPRGSVRG